MAGTSTPSNRLSALLPEWQRLLQGWAADGSLTAAAQEALVLTGAPKALTNLTTQWSSGVFTGIPEIVLLSSKDMNGAMGAYAISTGKIYLNQDWSTTATKDQVFAVLTEELGHHLDGMLNATDTPGDEGESFSRILFNRSTDLYLLQQQNDHFHVTHNGMRIDAELATTQARDISFGSKYIASLDTNGTGLVPDYYYSWQTIVGTAATDEYLATPYSRSLAEKYTTPAGFDIWTVWTDSNQTDYINLVGLNIEQLSFNGTYVSNNGGPLNTVTRFLDKGYTWAFKGGASNEIFLGDGSLYDSNDSSNLYVVAGDAGKDILFIPLVFAHHLKLERNDLGLSRVSYTDANGCRRSGVGTARGELHLC